MTAHQLSFAVQDAKEHGEKIVFTNGCFDIIHAGHVGYLADAKKLGDKLIVAINNDESVGRVKGIGCLLYTSPSPRDATLSRMPSSA